MSKSQRSNRESRKPPKHTAKEKKTAKRLKKQAESHKAII